MQQFSLVCIGNGNNNAVEAPAECCLTAMDMALMSGPVKIRWKYEARAQNVALFLPHSRLVKRGVARCCLNGALKEYCMHAIKQSLDHEVARLKAEKLS